MRCPALDFDAGHIRERIRVRACQRVSIGINAIDAALHIVLVRAKVFQGLQRQVDVGVCNLRGYRQALANVHSHGSPNEVRNFHKFVLFADFVGQFVEERMKTQGKFFGFRLGESQLLVI